jgi:hypothetical protein
MKNDRPETMSASADKNITASALFGVAAIQILVGAIGWFIFSAQLGWIDLIVSFSGPIYIALGIAAQHRRLPAALFGATLYAAFLGTQASQSTELLMTGLIFKVPVLVLLALALVFAVKRSQSFPGAEVSQPGLDAAPRSGVVITQPQQS